MGQGHGGKTETPFAHSWHNRKIRMLFLLETGEHFYGQHTISWLLDHMPSSTSSVIAEIDG